MFHPVFSANENTTEATPAGVIRFPLAQNFQQ